MTFRSAWPRRAALVCAVAATLGCGARGDRSAMSAGAAGAATDTARTAPPAAATSGVSATPPRAESATAASTPAPPSKATTLDSRHATADSLRGVIERAGSEPRTMLRLRARDGHVCELNGAVPATAEGLELVTWGDRTAPSKTSGLVCAFTATRFAVRAVDAIPAVDGMLRERAGVLQLEVASARAVPLPHAPAALRGAVGARIYWAGPLDRAPQAYGVLVPAVTR